MGVHSTLCSQLLIHFSTDCFETLHVSISRSEDVHLDILKLFLLLFLLCELSHLLLTSFKTHSMIAHVLKD